MERKLTFNKCSAKDLHRISALANRIWPISFAEILTPAQIEFMLNWMYSSETLQKQYLDGHVFYIAKMDDKDAGFVGLEIDFPESGQLRIHKIYLHPDYHGKKIGKWMMERVEGIAQEMSMEYVHLNVNRHNPAVDFYHKSGFETLYSEDIDIGKGYFMNDYVMRKKL